jgi:uncharacterized protein YecE (DUF72 family)
MSGQVRTGTAGWVFEPWRGTFFPEGLVQKKELAYASSRLGSIEINATFRANQKPESFAKWAGEARTGFVFSIKGPQLVTHIKRLKNCEQELANFFASGPLALAPSSAPSSGSCRPISAIIGRCWRPSSLCYPAPPISMWRSPARPTSG